MSKEAETSHSQPLPHFRSFRSDLHLHSSVVQCHSRKQQLIGMTPERGRNAEGRGQKWDAFPFKKLKHHAYDYAYRQNYHLPLAPFFFLNIPQVFFEIYF